MTDTNATGLSSITKSVARVFSMQNKKPGFVTMMAICVGLVIVQGSMITALHGIGIGGMGFIAALFVAFILAQFNAMSFAELSLMFPQEGTLATYTQQAIGHFPAIVAVFSGYVVVAMLALPVEMFLVDAIIGKLLPGLFPPLLLPLLILGFFALTNYFGADVFAKVQNLLAFVLISALILISLCAVTGAVAPHPVLAGRAVSWSLDPVFDGRFTGLVAMALWLMVGVEFICPMINEVGNPQRDIPRAMMLSLCAMFGIFLLFVCGVTYYLDVETLATSPLPYLDYANAVFGRAGPIVAAIMAVAATCSTVNTVLAAVPRMLYGMAINGQVFPQMKITSRRFGTPWVGILFMVAIIAIPLLLMDIDSLIPLVIAASTSWLLAYAVAHVDVLVLRRRLPHLARPFKTPLYPLPQILGIAAMLYVAFNNSPSPEMTIVVYKIIGGILVLISAIAVLWVKLYMKRKLFEPDSI